jgi:polyisoprenoid-binding protein YceI
MSAPTQSATRIPSGTYTADPIHSNANFEVEHAGVSIFRGGFKPIAATLVADDDGLRLEGSVAVESISVDDENIRPHLLSPEFFDAERNPDVRFRSTEITGSDDDLTVTGELSMAGVSLPVEATGRLRGPVSGPGGGEKLALALETVIDRTAFGMNWQMDIPGGGVALGNDVKLIVELELDRE